MGKTFVAIILSILFVQCNSVQHHNAHLNDMIAVNKLQKDVDFAYAKLKQLHPQLYWYISKEKLDYKIDSLKATITQPMTSFDFYKKIGPVLYSIRQGHFFLYPQMKMFSKQENKLLTKKGMGPLSQFELECFEDKLYVVKNKSKFKSIQPGTEIITINGKKVDDMLDEYKHWFTSDGYNTTLKKNFLGKRFSTFYSFDNGIHDSLQYEFKTNDSLKLVTVSRKKLDSTATDKKSSDKAVATISKADKKAAAKALRKKNRIYGYNELTKTYQRNFKFLESDSTVAVMKIRGFSNGSYWKFYDQCFKKMKERKCKALILDLRDNGGGRLSEINDLYSYLADTTYVFLKPSQVTSKTSLFHAEYFKGGGVIGKTVKLIFSPLYYSYIFFKVHKGTDGNYYYYSNTKPVKKDENAFNGKLYVMINGGSFSASSIISSNLKGSKRATFVGEETGGAYNGCVAGQMPLIKMPNSKIIMRVGLVAVKPFYSSEVDGRGIFPDKAISPTLEDRVKNNDPEMNWILEDIKKIK